MFCITIHVVTSQAGHVVAEGLNPTGALRHVTSRYVTLQAGHVVAEGVNPTGAAPKLGAPAGCKEAYRKYLLGSSKSVSQVTDTVTERNGSCNVTEQERLAGGLLRYVSLSSRLSSRLRWASYWLQDLHSNSMHHHLHQLLLHAVTLHHTCNSCYSTLRSLISRYLPPPSITFYHVPSRSITFRQLPSRYDWQSWDKAYINELSYYSPSGPYRFDLPGTFNYRTAQFMNDPQTRKVMIVIIG